MEELLERANKVYWENFDGETYFERAIFLSWYCSIGDCKFCYMSTQKNNVKDPKLAKRTLASLYAEAIIAKHLNWKIGFLSGGYGVYDYEQVAEVAKNVMKITGYKQILNIGVIPEDKLPLFSPYVEGICGSVETVNKELHTKVCPSKPLEPIENMYSYCEGYKKIMTLIIGLGETLDDFPLLVNFIEKNKIEKIVVYALNPIQGTVFSKGPEPDYYLEWLAKIRIAFPKLIIVAGVWTSRLDYLSLMLKAGANHITKLPAWKVIGTDKALKIKEEMEKAGRTFVSSFSVPKADWEKEVQDLDDKEVILEKINEYIK